MAAIGIDVLSVELKLAVLQQLSSSRDVYCLIRASSTYLQVFIRYKVSVLASVIQRAIPHEVLPDAIAARDASRVQEIVSTLPKYEGIRAQVQNATHLTYPVISAFMKTYRSRADTGDRLRNITTCMRLCRLWAIVDFFRGGL